VIRIPRTTLACIDCALPSLGARAMALSMRQCEYGQAMLLTDSPAAALPDLDARIRVVPIPPLASAREYSRFVMKELAGHVETDFVQLVQWDGYVIRGEAWEDAFLDYDYIGARWWFHRPPHDVGNGGFSLRSRRLLEATRDPAVEVADAEDDAICRVHRALLEERFGIRYAPGAVADRYAFEGSKPTGREFGFHAIYNLPRFLGEQALSEVLDAIPEDRFSGSSTVSLVEWLAFAGRKREALKYAKRMRARRYERVSPDFLGRLLARMPTLVGRNEPCPCGSGRAYKRCCGSIESWSPGLGQPA
jgi:hypothetical protein